ncbi:CRISPR-associated DxTHG motif protein [Labilibacter sediminis]|nr:CRISPR-associated DxTHG motif protein [Labilibacter sediminis]
MYLTHSLNHIPLFLPYF